MVAGFRNDPGAHGAAQHAIHQEVPPPPEQRGNLNPGGQQTVNLPPPPAGPRRTSFAAASGTPAPPAYREPAPPTRPSFGPPISEYSYHAQQQPYVYGWPSDQMQYSSQPMHMYGTYPSDWQQFDQQVPAPPTHTQSFDHVQQQLSQLLISQQDLMQRLNNQASQIKHLTETNDTLYHEKRALELSIEMGTAHKSGRPVSAASERAHISLAALGKRAKAFMEEDMDEESEKKPKKVDDVSERGSTASEDINLADCLDKYGNVMGTLTFSHDGGRVYPTPTRNHPAWRGTRRARRPRAHGSAEASPAQHHCTLRARSLTHSSLDAVQSGVANANHHCSSTANICTTTPSVHIARLHLPSKC